MNFSTQHSKQLQTICNELGENERHRQESRSLYHLTERKWDT